MQRKKQVIRRVEMSRSHRVVEQVGRMVVKVNALIDDHVQLPYESLSLTRLRDLLPYCRITSAFLCFSVPTPEAPKRGVKSNGRIT